MTNIEKYNRWMCAVTDSELLEELRSVKDDEDAINDRFYRPLEFGTGGMRGVIGAGSNRINIHTVGLATQALADWLAPKPGTHSVAIAHDSRNKSDVFAAAAAATLAANGITAYIFRELQPTPVLSYTVRKLGCSAGIVITASHNPAKYNGFKCYGADGCQMTDLHAGEVEACMSKLDIFDDVRTGDFDCFVASGLIKYIDDSLLESYLDKVQACAVERDACAKAGLSVIYTPLCGTGNKPVRAILGRIGITDVTVVPEQEKPNGSFPRCPFPNPEIREAFDASLELAESKPADLLLATDPDCDRVGIAVRDGDGYTLMSGNEVGAVMLDYLLSRRAARGTLSDKPVAVKSIVTSALADRIAEAHGCELRSCLTGFKYIGEIMSKLDAAGESDRFVMGYEESYGYLTGNYARDKDAVVGSMMICEMASYYKLQGKSLLDVIAEIYEKYGYYSHRLLSMEFEGEAGMKHMAEIMAALRQNKPTEVAGSAVAVCCDYMESVRYENGSQTPIALPKSNVLEFTMTDGSILTARPSGTEPKIKFYLTAAESTAQLSAQRLDAMEKYVRSTIK